MDNGVRIEFLELLSKTSRSFSLGILGLNQPLQDEICLGYLLCRIFDTYEDSVELPAHLRLGCLDHARKLLENLDFPSDFEALLAQWDEIHGFGSLWTAETHPDPWEHKLLRAGSRVWREIAALSAESRRAFATSLVDMIQGMSAEILDRQVKRNPAARSLRETDAYCYAVAGTVGRLLTALFRQRGAFGGNFDSEIEREGIEFGKALQLVNIMKDFHGDWSKGRCFWPGVEPPSGRSLASSCQYPLEAVFLELQDLFHVYLNSAMAYIRRLSPQHRDLVFFCSFPLRMAIATVEKAESDMSWLSRGESFKVGRDQVANILNELELAAP